MSNAATHPIPNVISAHVGEIELCELAPLIGRVVHIIIDAADGTTHEVVGRLRQAARNDQGKLALVFEVGVTDCLQSDLITIAAEQEPPE